VQSHFYQALKQVAGAKPPEFMKTVTVNEYCHDLSDASCDELQTWAVDNSNLLWCTGMGVIDAAIALVKDAVGNGNIKEDKLLVDGSCLSKGNDALHVYGDKNIRHSKWSGDLVVN
jgi:hypothetical protein